MERFAIERSYVQATLIAPIANIPFTGFALRGAAAIEDSLIPVFDLSSLFDLRPADDPGADHLIVLGSGLDLIALVASDPQETTIFEPSELAKIPWETSYGNAALVRGVAENGTILLDAEALLRDKRLQPAPPAVNGDSPEQAWRNAFGKKPS